MIIFNFLITKTLPLLPKWFAKPFASPYVAGETIEEVIQKVKTLNKKGFLATVDILGEHIKTKSEARKITNDYCLLYDKIFDHNLDCTISVKPTHLGLDISKAEVMKNIKILTEKADKTNNFLRLDMESSENTDDTISIYKFFKSKNSNIGIVIQAYLFRTQSDLDELYKYPESNIRLCKGIYDEKDTIAFKNKEDIVKNFILSAKKMARNNVFCAYATHDKQLIKELLEWIKNDNISKELFEFQCLYGVPMGGMLEKLKENGFKVRIYVPFGPDWYDYSLRRLNENPKIASYVLYNLFKDE